VTEANKDASSRPLVWELVVQIDISTTGFVSGKTTESFQCMLQGDRKVRLGPKLKLSAKLATALARTQ
jgi:hypothetical protein